MKRNTTDYAPGSRFGRLSVLGAVRGARKKGWRQVCLCDCGNKILTYGYRLKSGHTRSCGCLKDETAGKHSLIHGATVGRKRTPEHRSWSKAIGRCHCVTDNAYGKYGGRGIKVCERWLKSFKAFLDDMGKRPGPDYSLDRIDVNGDYCPENCRWATKKQQALNKRITKALGYQGIVRPLQEWSEILGFSVSKARYLMIKGVPDEEILFGGWYR